MSLGQIKYHNFMASTETVESKDNFYLLSVCVVAVIVAVGVFLRFFAGTPLWLDEAISASIAEKGPQGIVDALRHDGHPPLYYFLLYFWSSIFGDSDFALRALSGTISCFSVVLIYFTTRKFSNKWAALLTVGVLASSPFAIRYATEVRMYSLLALLILVSHILFEKTWRNPTPIRLFGISCVIACLLYTHYWSLFLVFTLGITLLLGLFRGKETTSKLCKKLGYAVALGTVTFIPWLPVFLEQLSHTGTPWSETPRPTVAAALALESYGGGRGSEALLVAVGIVILGALGLFSRKQDFQEENVTVLGKTNHSFLKISFGLGLITMIVGALTSFILDSAFQGRYAVFAFIPIVFCVGVGLSQTPRKVALVLLISLSLLSVGSVVRELSKDRTQIGEIATQIEENGKTGDTVVFCPDQLAPAANRVLDDRFLLYAYPNLDTGETVDWYDYEKRNTGSNPVELAERILSLHIEEQSIWLVWIDGYATFDSKCSELRAHLSAASASTTIFVQADGEQYYNSANLVKFSK